MRVSRGLVPSQPPNEGRCSPTKTPPRQRDCAHGTRTWSAQPVSIVLTRASA
ncbi:hypothetical protein I553_7441 [Mycobacterium xenopi 4042]|uniref:Uncharacterized protein n=1 Tax=Mycobacterium xenopi 4042 TaxID=1299334 RepID=X8E8C9_MYCXE|nr:hypothetical protein I553_7441 [Mycobacterium xenopi 4042]